MSCVSPYKFYCKQSCSIFWVHAQVQQCVALRATFTSNTLASNGASVPVKLCSAARHFTATWLHLFWCQMQCLLFPLTPGIFRESVPICLPLLSLQGRKWTAIRASTESSLVDIKHSFTEADRFTTGQGTQSALLFFNMFKGGTSDRHEAKTMEASWSCLVDNVATSRQWGFQHSQSQAVKERRNVLLIELYLHIAWSKALLRCERFFFRMYIKCCCLQTTPAMLT